MSACDVYAAIQDILDSTDLTEPAEIAEKLLADLDVHQRAEGFGQVAPVVVSHYVTRIRLRRNVPGGAVDDPPVRVATGAAPSGDAPGGVAAPSSPGQTKADRIREWWRGELRERFRGATEWLLLGEFAVVDHEYAAQQRRDRAAAMTWAADWHEACAHAMKTYKVERFDELPAAVLANLIAQRRVQE